jgi:tetratricopeptide (TPR) repeat protein
MSEDEIKTLAAQASALRRAGRVHEAIAAYEKLLALRPELPESWYNLGWLQRQARHFEAALQSYQQALSHGVSGPEEVHLNRAVILSDHLGRTEEAESELEQALAINPDYVPTLLNLGNLHEDRGQREPARAAYERALAVDPLNVLALARLAGLAEAAGPDDPLIPRLRAALERPDVTAADRADLGFALGRLLDAAGDYDPAFAAYQAANQANRESAMALGYGKYDAAAHEQFIDRLIESFAKPVRSTPSSPASSQSPIFICGMFRSGSSLTEQILAGHSRIKAGGELDILPSMIRDDLQPYPEAFVTLDEDAIGRLRRKYVDALRLIEPGDSIVTDKRPDNFLHIGLIKAMFPDARIVHTRRNSLDNILSLYFLHLNSQMAYGLDLLDAAHWYKQYQRLMAHWKALYPDDIFDLDYDALVREPQQAIEALLNFCGLEYEESCLAFHSTRSPVKTASVWQVREPLYSRASGRWRNYERHLGQLRAALGKP